MKKALVATICAGILIAACSTMQDGSTGGQGGGNSYAPPPPREEGGAYRYQSREKADNRRTEGNERAAGKKSEWSATQGQSAQPRSGRAGSEDKEAYSFGSTPLPSVVVTDSLDDGQRSQSAGSTITQRPEPQRSYTYDPAQGTVSRGDVWRIHDGGPVDSAAAPKLDGGKVKESERPDFRNTDFRPGDWDSYDDSQAATNPGEDYNAIDENPFQSVADSPLSTFSIDVDTASYSNIRRYLKNGSLPPASAVRIEEMINYFSYDYPQANGNLPFSMIVEAAECPWNLENRLVLIGLKGKEISAAERPASNLVFLIDVSGSMASSDKLPLLKNSFKLLSENLTANDTVSIVVYAGATGLALPPTSGDDRQTITESLQNLNAGGSTNGGSGIQLAYKVASENFIPGGINRVILATDGDFNVGLTDQAELINLIEEKAKSGVFLSVLGFGTGNIQDGTMEQLADHGNGNYSYIDSEREARKVLVDQVGGTLVTIAKDVKIQVEFNPAKVAGYRLVGYENRMLTAEEFNDDTKDAGEIGAGHTVTALYEVIPVGAENAPEADALRYQERGELKTAAKSDELMVVKLRYKRPEADTSKLLEVPVRDPGTGIKEASDDFIFAASVASFGMMLRHSEYQGLVSFDTIIELANSAKGSDRHGHRAEFVQLAMLAKDLRK